jgi:hypothetical protein
LAGSPGEVPFRVLERGSVGNSPDFKNVAKPSQIAEHVLLFPSIPYPLEGSTAFAAGHAIEKLARSAALSSTV